MAERLSPEPDVAAVEGYELAYERVCLARRTWLEAGSPLTVVLPNGIEATHPRWRTLHEAEAWFEKCRQQVRIKHRGPRPVAVIEGAIGASPAARLRAVTEKDA